MNALSKTCQECGKTFFKDTRNTHAYWRRAKFCSSKCTGNYNSKRAAAKRAPINDLFFNKVDKNGPNGCWFWTGPKDRDGYGIFASVHKDYPRTQRAHRFSLVLSGVDVPKGAFVCHHCDTPQCVNPSHLYVGTPQSNVTDAVLRNRVPRGERMWIAKLTEEKVRAMRNSNLPDKYFSEIYGVTKYAIALARQGKTWGHVQ